MTRKKTKTATIPEPAFPLARILLILPRRGFAFLAIALMISTPLQGRQRPRPKDKDYALIFGTVWGPDDQPVYGVKVKIRRANDKDKKARWEMYSNRLGEFEQRVPVGKQEYIVWADTKGYKSADGKHLQPGPEATVHIENNERADTGLHLK
jgi:hypothetical protein